MPFQYFVVNAPFGRFSPSNDSIFLVDGIKSWIIMELVSPLTFIYTFLYSPLTLLPNFRPHLTHAALSHPSSFFSVLFLIHYLNRAILSPLRTPSRNRSHIIVPLSAVCFNLVNGYLMGAYLSSPAARMYLRGAYGTTRFWFGLGLWALGFVGNIVHDEILFEIRRKVKAKGKGKDYSQKDVNTNENEKPKQKEHYAIPYGLLYSYISYPNYFCEWVEWLGFALASSPFPYIPYISSSSSSPSLRHFDSPWVACISSLSPPWLFFLAEVFLMMPRALRGHEWYKERFPDYPKERRAVIPWLI